MRARVTHFLASGRRALDAPEVPSWRRKYSSPALLGLYRQLIPHLKTHASGRVLDVGCGTMPYRRFVEGAGAVTEYRGVDLEPRGPGVTLIPGIHRIEGVGDGECDTVLCTEVLEHVSNPGPALAEIRRVLRTGGILVLSVPFLARLHEEPHDYFRYTEHGLRHLLTQYGFKIREIRTTGSVFSFLGHQVASVLVASTTGIPLVRDFIIFFSALLVTVPCQALDQIFLPWRILPLGYVAVAEKTSLPG